MMWPFRTASPRDEYEAEPEQAAQRAEPAPKPKVMGTKRYDIAGGILDKQIVHVCTPPTQEELTKQDRYAKLEKGDRWTCKTCAKPYYWVGLIWSEFSPEELKR